MENVQNELVGKRIKNAREKAGYTQYRLHDLTGISITQISAYENGKRSVGLSSLRKIAEATNTTMDELYSGKIEDRPMTLECNEGKLIVNCITILFEKGVVSSLPKSKGDSFRAQYSYQIGFCDYVNILDDFIKKMVDFEKNKPDYPNPSDFKSQLVEAASNKINRVINLRKDKKQY